MKEAKQVALVTGANKGIGPGVTSTDLSAHRGHQTVEEGAKEIVRVALLEHGASGQFLETGRKLIG